MDFLKVILLFSFIYPGNKFKKKSIIQFESTILNILYHPFDTKELGIKQSTYNYQNNLAEGNFVMQLGIHQDPYLTKMRSSKVD